MIELPAALAAWGALAAIGFAGWLASVVTRDVSIVGSLGSLLFHGARP